MVIRLAARLFLAVVVVVVLATFAANSFAADKALELSRALGQAKLFEGLTDKERAALESAATLRHCKEGERIIEQGKPLDRMFIVLEGQAEVRVNGKLVATLPDQSLVGEVEFVDMLPASADVVILKNTRLIELNNAALTSLMKRQPRLGYVLMSEIARIEGQRLRTMDLKLDSAQPSAAADRK
ncbi:MAG: cyclic nucleotide-binding domain-containing protein [Candidatus Desulfaltia sp.]|nr:cyclic nucleotide-binding domain-containing protein [Candidatus Desulfaltia sp.]